MGSVPGSASTWPSEAEIFGDDLEDLPELPLSELPLSEPSAESFFDFISGDTGSEYDSDSSSPADNEVVADQHVLSVRRLMRQAEGQVVLDDADPVEEISAIPGESLRSALERLPSIVAEGADVISQMVIYAVILHPNPDVGKKFAFVRADLDGDARSFKLVVLKRKGG